MADNFKINWVLNNELALGSAPLENSHIKLLKEEGLVSILSLCSEEEAKPPEGIEKLFRSKRIVLPDHSYSRSLKLEELQKVLQVLEGLSLFGPVFVHCKAAVERSPLICMAWLIKKHKLNPIQALDYLMRINKGTSPMQNQLKLLYELKK